MRADDIFRRQHLRVFRYLRRCARNRELAEELTQEVFVRVVKALPRYRAEGREEAWVLTIARNVFANHQRQYVARPPEHDLENAPEPSHSPEPAERLELDRALSELPELDRETFLLREVGGLSHSEIADACRITAAAVRNRIYRARESLRESLAVVRGRPMHRARESRP